MDSVQVYRVIGRVRYGPGDVLILSDPEQIAAFKAAGIIEDRPQQTIKLAKEQKQEAE